MDIHPQFGFGFNFSQGTVTYSLWSHECSGVPEPTGQLPWESCDVQNLLVIGETTCHLWHRYVQGRETEKGEWPLPVH